MSKKIAIVLICCVLAAVALPFTACGEANPPVDPSVSGLVTLTQDGVRLEFPKAEGAEEYRVYRSPSRFGEYELVSTQKERSYVDENKYDCFRVDAIKDGQVIKSTPMSYDLQTFGENVHIYAPTDDRDAIAGDIDAFMEKTEQFSAERFAAFFKAGDYSELNLGMRYYMTYAGLGDLPTDVKIGDFDVDAELSDGNATCNFWRGIENMQVSSDVKWAVSQATSFRRMYVDGGMTLTETQGGSPWGSGGFIADSVVTGTIGSVNQQQWLTRNTEFGKWSGSDINMVFAGCDGQFADSSYVWGNRWITDLENTNVMREKPFLVFNDDGYYVCVPPLVHDTKGASWTEGNFDCDYLPLDDFYVAKADRDTAETLNNALKKGKHLFFTPGIYLLDKPLLITEADTIVMGCGLATLKLTAKNTDTAMRISDVDGVKISGVIFDAGPSSKSLIELGQKKTSKRHTANPTVLSDVYFRIGGAEDVNTKVTCTLIINSNDVVGDNFWVWRADHSNGVGWKVNETENGVIINGDYVTIYGLMVEHFHKYQTIWNGEHGFMAFYQSETPYDVEDQSEWMSNWNGTDYEGYASYKVADSVQNHTAYGIGVYFVARNWTDFTLDHAVEAPGNSGIHIEHMGLANFSSPDGHGIRHVINDQGKDVIRPFQNPKTHFESYIAGEYTE